MAVLIQICDCRFKSHICRKKLALPRISVCLSLELSSGEVPVLPLLVRGEEERQKILDQLPLLSDKLYLDWEGDPPPLQRAMT